MKTRPQNPAQQEESEHSLFSAMAMLKNANEVGKFMKDLCTPAEMQSMADRWKVVFLLKEGKSYRKIHDETGVSVTTVGRVARFLIMGADGYNLIFERIRKKYEKLAKAQNSTTKKRPSQLR